MGNILKSIALLLVTASPALALPTNPAPEPETLALVAIGVVAALLARRKNKKK